MLRRTALVLLSLTWSFVAAHGAGELSKGRDVVVLVGVAGDLESEKAYADELNGLLDALAAPAAQPRSLTLLVENPAKWKRPFPFPVKVLSDKRESLLTLKGTDPDLVVAWGHGGMMGARPVLHVPGPRLQPDDFAALAAPGSAKAADYVLYFRGSQEFARAVSTAQRRALASESEKMFSYDPIGVPLLLDGFGKAANLPALAALTAKAVGDWYKTRSQVGTEQPTLWADAHPALLPELPEAPAANLAGTAATPAPEASTVTGGPSSAQAWLGLPVVKPADFPEADAVVLRETVQCVIGDNPQLSQEEESFVQILTSDGKRVGDLNLAFSPPEENLTILDCEIRSPNGHIERVDTGAQAEGGEGEQPEEYPGARRKFFAVPNVVPGSTLRVHQRRAWKHFPLPKVYLSLPLAGEFPVLEKQMEVRVPAKLPFHFAWKNPPKFARDTVAEARGSLPYQFHWKKSSTGNPTDPTVETGPYGTVYRWQFEKVPALSTDPLQAPDRDPELLATTFGDWGEFLAWYQGIIRETDQPTPEMTAKAAELTRGLTTDTDKIRALFRYVTDLRYISVPIGVNAYRPHAAANVFHHRYGDCKDKANLLNTLLKSQGFDAKLVLAPRFAEALDAVPGAEFNHAISHVNLHGQSLWLDSTDDICRFGLLPPGDPGRNVLLITDKEQGLRTLPVPAAADSTLTLTSDLTLAVGDGGQLRGRSEAKATGIMDYALRMGARQSGSRRHSSDVLAGLLKPDAGAATLGNQNFTNPGDLGQDFAWSADTAWEGLVSKVGTAVPAVRDSSSGRSPSGTSSGPQGTAEDSRPYLAGRLGQPSSLECLVRAPFQVPAEWTAALQPRSTALFLNMGYPCRIVQRVTLHLPAGGKLPGALPAESRQTDGPLQYALRWSPPDPVGSGSVDGELTLTLAKADLTLAEAVTFQQTLRALHGALAQGVLVELPTVAPAAAASAPATPHP